MWRKPFSMESRVTAHISLGALRHNYAQVKSMAPGAKVLAMVKANAYGHGLLIIAKALEGADAFGVHSMDDAILLRGHFPGKRIVLMAGVLCQSELALVSDYRLDLVVHSEHQLELLGHLPSSKSVVLWGKINTGMNRLGFASNEMSRVYGVVQKLSCHVEWAGWMTHFSESSNVASAQTGLQMRIFEQAIGDLPGARSMANSAAILAWPATHADWVRPGLMLYGGAPLVDKSAKECGLRAVMTLTSRLISVLRVSKGERLGYDRTWLCHRDSVIGIISVGYGDGYPRHASFGTPVLVAGQRCPLVGRVSMDLIYVDLTDNIAAKVGDIVVLWGDELPIDEVARSASTISYELFCHVGSRVSRNVVDLKPFEVI
jgi:alanine racemase